MYNSFRKQFRPLFPMQALRESVARGFQEETPSTTNETPEAATQQQEQFKQLVVNKFWFAPDLYCHMTSHVINVRPATCTLIHV